MQNEQRVVPWVQLSATTFVLSFSSSLSLASREGEALSLYAAVVPVAAAVFLEVGLSLKTPQIHYDPSFPWLALVP